MSGVSWVTAQSGYDTAQLGRYTVIVWTGSPASDLDDGCEVMECYIPTTDRQCPDGRMVVGRRRLDTKDRATAREMALAIAYREIAYLESGPRP